MFSRSKIIIFTFILSVILLIVQIYVIKTAVNYEPKFDAVFAKVFIPSGTQITKDMLEIRKTDTYHPKAYKAVSGLEGKFAAADIDAGEMIISSRITDMIKQKSTVCLKNPDNVLYTIEFKPDQANGFLIKPDTLVHLIFVPDINRLNDSNDTLKDVILFENVRIAAVIDDKLKLYSDSSDSVSTNPKYVCFELTKEQFKIIAQAKSRGRIELAATG
ncbi:MAG: RcpC/CpaB family pilus assembly protein [Thermoplasmata archaeon]